MANYNSQLSQTYGNSLNNVNYKGAQAYYQKLRERFLKELSQNQQLETKKSQQEIIEQFYYSVMNSRALNDEQDVSTILNKIFSNFVNVFNSNTNLISLKAEAQKEIQQAQLDINSKIEEEKKTINKILYKLVNQYKEEIKNVLVKILMDEHSGISQNMIQERYDGLIARASQLTTIALKALLRDKMVYELTGIPAATLGGYIKEDLEFQALQAVFSQIQNVQITPGGTKKAGTKNKATHLDNIISFVDFVNQNFDKQIRITEDISNYITLDQMLNNIHYYGEQVKTLSLLHRKGSSTNYLGKRVADNKALFDSWMGFEKKQQYATALNIYRNIRFLARQENTVAALGGETLMIATGDGRYFTDEFIKFFYKQEFYLMFAHSTEKNNWIPTIVLDQPWKKGKHARKTVYSDYKNLI